MTTERINLWDFDEVLAHSLEVVTRFANENPEVPYWKWWHCPELSTRAALVTEAIEEMWAMLAELPGEHWVLTARNGDAVEAWLDMTGRRDVFARVISTSRTEDKDIPARIKKTWHVEVALEVAEEVHFFDDSLANLREAEARCEGVITHHVIGAGVIA